MFPQLLNAIKPQKRTFMIDAGDNLFFGDVTEARRFGVMIYSEKKIVDGKTEGQDKRALFVKYTGKKSEDIAYIFKSSKSVDELTRKFFPNFIKSHYLIIDTPKESFLVDYKKVLGIGILEGKHLQIYFQDHSEIFEATNIDEIGNKMLELEEMIARSEKHEEVDLSTSVELKSKVDIPKR